MANIIETLTLHDRFSATYKKYIDQAEKAKSSTERFRQQQERTEQTTNRFAGAIGRLGGAFLGLQGLKALTHMSDDITESTARLNMLNGELENTENLNQKVFESANRSRGAFNDTADMVAKLGSMAGDAFGNDANQVVAFAEQLNKSIAISGVSAQSANAAMIQLTQAMASGVLRGDELRSVMEQMPFITKYIAEYLEVDKSKIRELAAEGKITADIVKNAVFAAADETNAKFSEMPMTWAQVWTKFGNYAKIGLAPLLVSLSWVANHLNIILPILGSLGTAFIIFQLAAHWTQIATFAVDSYHVAIRFLSIGFGVLTGQTGAAAAAQTVYNSALLACPITWVVMLIMLLIGALYAGVAAWNYFTDSSLSATGIIMGGVYTLGAFIFNTFALIHNSAAALCDFLANVFIHPVASIQILFLTMVNNVLSYFRQLAAGIQNLLNRLPGIEVNLTSGIDNAISLGNAGIENIKKKSGWKEQSEKMELKDYASSFKKGYERGSGFAGNFKEKFGSVNGISSVPAGVGIGKGDDVGKKLGKIGKDVSDIKKSVDISKEDTKLIVDMATRRYVNKINFTSQTPIININGANTGNTENDRVALAEALKGVLTEQLAAGSSTPSVGLI